MCEFGWSIVRIYLLIGWILAVANVLYIFKYPGKRDIRSLRGNMLLLLASVVIVIFWLPHRILLSYIRGIIIKSALKRMEIVRQLDVAEDNQTPINKGDQPNG